MSIRLRLTVLYSVILATTLIGLSIASYLTVAHVGFNRLVDTLASKADRIVIAEEFQLNDIEALSHQFAGPEVYVQTRDETGNILDQTPNLVGNNLRLTLTERNDSVIESAWVDIMVINDERRLIYNLPIINQGTEVGVLQLSNSLSDRDNSLNNLMQVLVAGNVLVILGAFGIGWFVAGIGLRPIFSLSEAILDIGYTRDFAKRIHYGGADDEIGQLANTFDEMLSELEDAHRQTEQALKAQNRFVADASHELRTPLTTVRGNLELLRRDPPITEDDRVAVLTDLNEETDRLIRLVNDLLVLARADVQPPKWQDTVLLQPLLESVERQMGQLAPNREICFKSDGDSASTPISFLGNEDALKQVLLILLDNAIKHTPPSSQISVHTAVCDSTVEISVCDTGTGISQEELSRIFDRFYVVDTASTQDSSGLGLAIAKTLVESQNGRLSVVSSHEGTTFKVNLSCQK